MARRRAEDNFRLYEFAKKYQENQNSSELIKKQNAAEEKVLSARLEYLNNRKELTKKTMEKEINLVRRKCSSGRESSRRILSSYQLDRTSLPNTPSSSRGCRSGKCARWLSLPQLPSANIEITSSDYSNQIDKNERNVCRTDVPPVQTPQQHDHVAVNNEYNGKEANISLEETNHKVGNPTRVNSPTAKHSGHEKQTRNSFAWYNRTKPFGVGSTLNFTNDAIDDMREIDGNQENQNTCKARSHSRGSMEARRQDWMRTPTPFPKQDNIECLLKSSSVLTNQALTDKWHKSLRYSRTMSDLGKLRLCNNTPQSYARNGVAAKDLRFKKLESVLVPIKP